MTTTLRMFTNGTDYVIAEDAAGAVRAWCERMGEDQQDYAEQIDDWRALPNERPLAIWCEGEDASIAHTYNQDGARHVALDTRPITRTCAEWVAREGAGWLCSSES